MGLPAFDAFPRKLWTRLVAQQARAGTSADALNYPAAAGHPQLREAIAAYLAISRGVACGPEQIFVTAGYQGALSIVARVLVAPEAPVLVEDPGYHLTHRGSLRLVRALFRWRWTARECGSRTLPSAGIRPGWRW
jgi:GntR family transcriptional regulator/MocR family aminotransferase